MNTLVQPGVLLLLFAMRHAFRRGKLNEAKSVLSSSIRRHQSTCSSRSIWYASDQRTEDLADYDQALLAADQLLVDV